jgi:hypothetical protein
MRQALGWSDGDFPRVRCPDLEQFQHRLSATSLSVVFVSHYLNNPSSAFGHTMLYLGSDSERNAMLADYSVSFEADTEGMTPGQYLPRGLFGKLVAAYRVAPLHERVRKYERQEQRDLWLFPLMVSQGEIDQLVRHLWELRNVTFRYGFFGGNCAQKILGIVHAVAPKYGLLPFSDLAVLPSEVSRRLVERIGLAGEPMQRPSLWGQYSRQVSRLSAEERGDLAEMVASRRVVDGVSPATLMAALVWSEIETPYRAFRRESETEDHPDLVWRREIWASLAADTNGRQPALTAILQEPGPSVLQAHRPSRFTLHGGYNNDLGGIFGGEARWLLHEAVDPQAGYPPVSSVEVGRVEMDMSATGHLRVNEATVLRVERLAPVSSFQSPIAWKIELGARRLPFDGEWPLSIGAEIGIGAGAALLRPAFSLAVYSMVGARPSAAIRHGGTEFLAAGIWSGGVLLRMPADVRARFSGEYVLSLTSLDGGAAGFEAVVRKGLTRDWDIEFAATHAPEGSLLTVGLVAFH